MPLLVDTGVLYALADRRDAWHGRVVSYLGSQRQPLLVPVTVVPEVAYLLRERIGARAESAFADSLSKAEIAVESVASADWRRIAALVETYDFLGVVDA